jgi:CubicO group peptidase (beta-lactamase class C family)
MQDDQEIYSYYKDENFKKLSANIASAGKSISSVVFGIAIDQGYFSVNDSIAQYITEEIGDISKEELGNIKIQNLLTMSSGLDNLLNQSYEVGQGWEYSDAWNLLFTILEKTTGQTANEFAKENLFHKIGMNNTEYRSSMVELRLLRKGKPSFTHWNPQQIFCSTTDLVRFGEMILANGNWNGEQIISRDYLLKALTPYSTNPAYGYLFWLNENSGGIAAGTGKIVETNIIPNAPKDTIAALGMGDKKLCIVPSLRMVVARHGNAAYGQHFAFTQYDNELWSYLNRYIESKANNTTD